VNCYDMMIKASWRYCH